ncbi:hypothetical protein [Nocardia sp. NBC_01327]|nr:hypothetical protein OG326_21290 [Nocardia sp. NBC_01327]
MSAHLEVLSANQFGRPTNARVAADQYVADDRDNLCPLIFAPAA